jgi:hypothetical protein
MNGPGTNGPGTPIPLGVYRSSAVDIGVIQDYEKNFLNKTAGAAASYVLAYLPDNPGTWAQFEQAVLAASTNGPPGTETATAWAPLLGERTLMLGVPACCQGTTWADEAAGANDAHWTALATTLVNGGLGHCVLRIAREFNGSWYPWQVTAANAGAYQSGYAHIVQTMRDAGFTGTFMWNSYLGQGNFARFSPPTGVESVYPLADGSSGADTIVDLIGLDVYDGPDAANYPRGEVIRTLAQQQAAWDSMLTQWDGLTGWRALAVDHGKPLCYPEWGLRLWNDNHVYTGGGDNPTFILEMAAWLKNTQAHMHAFWEDPGMGVADPDDLPRRLVAAPNARAAFLGQFGYH